MSHRSTLKTVLKNTEGRYDICEKMVDTQMDKICQ